MNVLLIDISPFTEANTPISLGYLGAALKRAGHEVLVRSYGTSSRLSLRSMRRLLKDFHPSLVGLGAYQRNLVHALGLARLVKHILPDAYVVLGGPQATFLPDEALPALPEVDFVSRGDGEPTVLAIVEALEGGLSDEPVPGTSRLLASGEVATGERLRSGEDLDEWPSPWLTGILDPAELDENIMLTSRGCPHDCTFCYTPAAASRRIRYHSVERVLDEIEYVSRRGTGRLWFADPNFSYRNQRVVRILEGIVQRGLSVSMWVESRADMLDRELVALMKRAGVRQIAMGLESASVNVLPDLNKRLQPELIRSAVRIAFEHGIDVELFSQFALPNETYEDAMQTLRFVQDCGVRIRGNSNAQQMQIYFGTAISADPQAFGVRPTRKHFEPYLSIGAEFETRCMSSREIERVRQAWRESSEDGAKRVVS